MLLSAEDLASLEATLELLADSEAVARLADAEKEIAAGGGTTAAEMAELMQERRERESAEQ